MPALCMYFQVHQPFRIRSTRAFDLLHPEHLFDTEANRDVMRKVAQKCYIPTNALLFDLIERHGGAFKVAMSITGVAVEQMREHAPEALASFQRLVATGCVELLGETYYHSLAALFDSAEFAAQVDAHKAMCRDLFDAVPRVFRNTELIYDDEIGRMAAQAGFRGILAEGCDDILGWRSPNFVYGHPDAGIRLLLKNYRLSDDIAFRFSDRSWSEHPLTADRFAGWLHSAGAYGSNVNLFMDYETFGEHQWADSGIFDFLDRLPDAVLQEPAWSIRTPSEVLDAVAPVGDLSFGRTTSWADGERDVSAWLGNRIQRAAAKRLYSMGAHTLPRTQPDLTKYWRRLLTSDHLYYMSTKCAQDGDVHAYFSPFDGPYDAFIALQNAMHHLERAVETATRVAMTPGADGALAASHAAETPALG